MSKQVLANALKGLQSVVKKYTPEILGGIGIAGMITTTILAVRATPKALILIEEAKAQKVDDTSDELKPLEVVKATWPCYVPAAVIGIVSVGCLIGASSTNFRRNAALATAYHLSESTLKEYQEKVIESIGPKKEETIRESVAKEKLERSPIREVIITENGGNTICFDALSGRYFKSDRDKITKAVNELNREMRDVMSVSLNDFYYELGLAPIKVGDLLGWNIDKGYIELDFSSHLDANGTPCLVIDYRIAPVYDY